MQHLPGSACHWNDFLLARRVRGEFQTNVGISAGQLQHSAWAIDHLQPDCSQIICDHRGCKRWWLSITVPSVGPCAESNLVDVRGNTSVLLDKDLPRKILPGWREVRHEIGTLTLMDCWDWVFNPSYKNWGTRVWGRLVLKRAMVLYYFKESPTQLQWRWQ